MRGGTTQEKIIYWLFADKIPLTKLLIVINVATFLAIVVFRQGILELLTFRAGWFVQMPWTAFTYPLIGKVDPIGLLFSGYWLWIAGGSLERSWGTRTFAYFFFIMSAISAFSIYLGSVLVGADPVIAGLWLPLAAVTIAFAMQNPEQQILFFFIIPMKLKYLALLVTAFLFVAYARYHPIIGVLALAGCALAYWYVRGGKEIFYRPEKRFERQEDIRVYNRPGILKRMNPFWRYKEYKQRKRLRDFLDRSGLDE